MTAILAAMAWSVFGLALAQSPAPNVTSPSATPAPPPVAAPDTWLPRAGFELQALDKVTTRTVTVTGRVGQPVRYGTLTITVRACVVRPPEQPADAAAFLDIVDSLPGLPRFSGWMVVSAPSVSMLEHPVYDIRLTGCRA